MNSRVRTTLPEFILALIGLLCFAGFGKASGLSDRPFWVAWKQPVEEETDTGEVLLMGVHFADARSGWAVGTGGTILATCDGGEHWNPKPSGTQNDLTGPHFADSRI